MRMRSARYSADRQQNTMYGHKQLYFVDALATMVLLHFADGADRAKSDDTACTVREEARPKQP